MRDIIIYAEKAITVIKEMLESRLDEIIFKLIQEHEFVAFLTGYDGEFDRIATYAVKCAKREYAREQGSLIRQRQKNRI